MWGQGASAPSSLRLEFQTMTDTEKLLKALQRIVDIIDLHDQKAPGYEHPRTVLDRIEACARTTLRLVDPDGSLRREGA